MKLKKCVRCGEYKPAVMGSVTAYDLKGAFLRFYCIYCVDNPPRPLVNKKNYAWKFEGVQSEGN